MWVFGSIIDIAGADDTGACTIFTALRDQKRTRVWSKTCCPSSRENGEKVSSTVCHNFSWKSRRGVPWEGKSIVYSDSAFLSHWAANRPCSTLRRCSFSHCGFSHCDSGLWYRYQVWVCIDTNLVGTSSNQGKFSLELARFRGSWVVACLRWSVTVRSGRGFQSFLRRQTCDCDVRRARRWMTQIGRPGF